MIALLFALPAFLMTGEYLEVRSNEVYTCACLYSGAQATGGREAILAWSIHGGQFRGVSLAGTKAVAVIDGQANLGIDGAARQSVLYIDSAGSGPQQDALVSLLREYYGNVLGEVLAVHAAPIAFERRGDGLVVSVREVAMVEVRPARLPDDAHQGSTLWYQPFIASAPPALMVTEYIRYSGAEFRHTWWERDVGITAFLTTFRLPG